MIIERPDQVWCMDISDVPMAPGFVYLAAVIDSDLTFYNGRRPRSSLHRQMPDQAYFTRLPQAAAA